MDEQTLKHYDQHAEALSAQYQAAEPEALHKLLMRWLPSSGSVLEIGCGSGRDAVYMAGLGLNVVATDGSTVNIPWHANRLHGLIIKLCDQLFLYEQRN